MPNAKTLKPSNDGSLLRPLMFMGLPERTLGEIVELASKTKLHGQIVMAKDFIGLISLQDHGVHCCLDGDEPPFYVRVLPPGTVVTLTQRKCGSAVTSIREEVTTMPKATKPAAKSGSKVKAKAVKPTAKVKRGK